jgi:hypothetical protein
MVRASSGVILNPSMVLSLISAAVNAADLINPRVRGAGVCDMMPPIKKGQMVVLRLSQTFPALAGTGNHLPRFYIGYAHQIKMPESRPWQPVKF